MENRRCRGARRMPFGNCGRAAVVFGLASGVIGCGMPNTFHITKGQEPQYADDDYVRFRTTYYFRVFDVCDEANNPRRHEDTKNIFPDSNGQPLRLLKDSIYRFRMTGKASSLFSIVHFEAGTLKSYQIDPFGATVAFDETNRRFYFKSQQDTEADAKQDASLRNIRLYLDLRSKLDPNSPLRAEYDALIRDEIRGLGTARPGAAITVVAKQIAAAYAEGVKATDRAQTAALAAKKAAGAENGAITPPKDELGSKLSQLAPTITAELNDTRTAISNLVDTADKAVKEAEEAVAKALQANTTAATAADAAARQAESAKQDAAAAQKREDDATVKATSAKNESDEAQKRATQASDDVDQKKREWTDLQGKESSAQQKATETKKAYDAAMQDVDNAPENEKEGKRKIADAKLKEYSDAQRAFEVAQAGTRSARGKLDSAETNAAKTKSEEKSAQQKSQLANDALDLSRTARAQADKASNGAEAPRKQKVGDAADKLEKYNEAQRALAETRDAASQVKRRQAELEAIAQSEQAAALRSSGNDIASDQCPPGSNKRRGFQVMGPEGIRTFNQDERLIMAMSSDGKPLVSTLQDLSNRVLGPQVNQAEQRLPLADERLRISEARRILDREKPDKAEDAAKVLDEVAAKFKNGGGAK